MMHLYKDEHIKDGTVHSQRIMQNWDGVPTAEHRLNLGITSDILHLSAFCTQIWAGQSFFFVPSLLRNTRLEATKSTPERKHKDATLEFLISD